MVNFDFIGDVSELSDKQKQYIANVVKEHGYKSGIIEVKPVGKAGDNYAANVKRIVIEKDGKTFKMIAKIAPRSEMGLRLGNVAIFFGNEYIMYSKVLSKFTELEKGANIPENERLRYAVCYGTYMEELNELILLEDLDVSGFKMLDRFTSLTDDNVRLVLKNFAILHSLSFVLKYQEPETYEYFTKKLKNAWLEIVNNPDMQSYAQHMDDDVQQLLDDDKYKKFYKNAAMNLKPETERISEKDSNSKYNVIQQGDSWTNNIMFRLENDKTVECCMIDYQFSKTSTPVADLHYMIFNCTDHETRVKYYHEWIDLYHSHMEENLKKYGLKINEVYPREQLDEELKDYVKLSLGLSIMLASVLTREADDAAKIKEAMNSSENSEDSVKKITNEMRVSHLNSDTINKFKARLYGVVDSFIEFGYL